MARASRYTRVLTRLGSKPGAASSVAVLLSAVALISVMLARVLLARSVLLLSDAVVGAMLRA